MPISESFQSELMLSEEEKKEGFWFQDEVHLANPLSPLFASFMVPAVTEGTRLAFDVLKFPLRQFCFKLSDGRIYQANVPFQGDLQQRLNEHKQLMNSLLPNLRHNLDHYVEKEFLPFYRRLDEYRSCSLTPKDAKEKVLELFQFYQRAWQLHFEIVLPRSSFMALGELYTQLTGDPNSDAVYDLLLGVMNKSLETDRELWRLAGLANQSPEMRAVFAASPAAGYVTGLEASEAGRAFLEQLHDVLEKYGYRSANSHEFNDITWVENPEYPLCVIAAYMKKDYNFDEEFAQRVREREAKTAEALAKMPDGELKQTFIMLHQWALDAWGLDEDHHFYIDAMLPAKSRRFLLNVGGLLVAQGVVADREDVFYLYLDELLNVLDSPSDQNSKVEQRRAEYEASKSLKVPPFYGVPPQEKNPLMERIFGGRAPEIREKEQTFTGYAASQGRYTGTVKVVRGREDFAKIQKGDVLVCKTTTPPWTVLFTLAGAIVTDAGGILSHAGTVAREYKLPAVVGTRVATSLLKDGDRVTVDGTEGVVYFGQS
ncbi:PEP-utilizing enzyme [Paenibacillus cremeus]|uniref:PEP-utilizing protein n=1 Tax=Paenibacillus cremeus TaxID=2163881 RepID=A0A559JKD9_9BACL|nr:PEP-utilizing enzyme [Paenibacillus cremeus]TVY00343.1 PEP-utilizing protein [Paenibacillus cremeus]